MKKQMTAKEMLDSGGKLIGHTGLQKRPIIEYGGKIYEKAIHFDDGLDHSNMCERGST